MRIRAITAVLTLVVATLAVLGAQATVSSASAGRCGYWVHKMRVVNTTKKNMSSIYSKRNSNRNESASLTVGLESNTTDSSAVTYGVSVKLGNAIAEVEQRYDVSVTRSVSSGVSIQNEMRVMPLHYGRTRWQTIRKTYEKYKYFLSNETCERRDRTTIWKARMITSKIHFAECQDKKNQCRPR